MTRSDMRKSLDVVAAIEAAKGVIVLLAGFGLLGLLHRDLHALGDEVVAHLHLNPAKKYPRVFLDLIGSLNDRRLWFLACMALFYSTLRFFEAYGLWHGRSWAEWLALVGAGIYLPIEIYELAAQITIIRVSALVFNLLVLLLMGRVLWQKRENKHADAG